MLKNIHVTVNGREMDLQVDVRESLLDVLRNRLHLTGTKQKKPTVSSKIPKFVQNLQVNTQKRPGDNEQKITKNSVQSAKNSINPSSGNIVFQQPFLQGQKNQKQNSQDNLSTPNNQPQILNTQQKSQKQISLGHMDMKTATQNVMKTFATLTGSLTQSLSNAGTVGSNGTTGGRTTNGGQTKSNSTNSGYNKASSQQQT